MTDISRRKVLAIIAAGVGSVAAKASGLMPEIAMARNADGPAAQGVTPEGNLAIEELDRDGIAQLIAEGQLNADTRALWQLLEKDGLRPQPQLGYGARAHLRRDRGAVGGRGLSRDQPHRSPSSARLHGPLHESSHVSQRR